jgi:carbamoyltransferase
MRPADKGSSGGDVTVLGVNAAHDAAACLVIGGELRVAIAEERLSRRKHQDLPPWRAINHCLEEADLASLDALDCIVVNEQPHTDCGGDLRRKGFRGELFVNPSHHLLHAYYAAAASGKDRAAILVVDGSGYSYAEHKRQGSPLLGSPPPFADMEEAESSFAFTDGDLRLVERRWGLWEAELPYIRFPSLGHMYSAASQYIFGHWVHAGKTMGLAPHGDPSNIPEPIVTYGSGGLSIDTEWILRQPPRSDKPAHLDSTCCDIAAKVQVELEDALLFLARRLHDATGMSRLCFSGGVALNGVANARLRREGPFSEMFVTPAASDSGTCVGAAVYGHARLTGEIPRWNDYSDFLGAEYGADRVGTAVRAVGDFVRPAKPQDPATDAAKDIAGGRVVGWFEGRSELGPRALGHRSILCDPRSESICDYLNEWVKFREPFRPYAASVLEEHAHRYFEVEWIDRFMLSVVNVRPEYRDLLPSIRHIDDTCRIQMVPKGEEGYRRLIEAFFEATGLPLVLNTSLNIRGEPIVETPEDALACFLGTNIDLLYVEGRRLEKPVLDAEAVDADLVPHPNPGVAVNSKVAWSTDRWSLEGPEALTRTGDRVQISEIEASVLRRVDGLASVGELTGDSAIGPPEQIVDTLVLLQRRGLISMAMVAT